MVLSALFDLQPTVSNNLTTTCTSEKCLRKCRNRNSDYAIRLEDLNTVEPVLSDHPRGMAK